jgi:hypothetical protein
VLEVAGVGPILRDGGRLRVGGHGRCVRFIYS